MIAVRCVPPTDSLASMDCRASYRVARKNAALGMDQPEFLANAAVAGTASWVQQRPRCRQKLFTALGGISERSSQQRSERRNFPLPERLHSTSTIISTSTALLEG